MFDLNSLQGIKQHLFTLSEKVDLFDTSKELLPSLQSTVQLLSIKVGGLEQCEAQGRSNTQLLVTDLNELKLSLKELSSVVLSLEARCAREPIVLTSKLTVFLSSFFGGLLGSASI